MTTLATALLVSGLLASGPEAVEGGQTAEPAGEHQAAHATHAEHSHHLALFGGVTMLDTFAGWDVAPTLGVEYEFRLPFANRVLGVGPIAELAIREHSTFAGIAALWAHPVAGLKVGVGPGLEMGNGHSEFLLRGGLGYDLHLGPVTLTPSAFADLVAGEFFYVAGASVGMGF